MIGLAAVLISLITSLIKLLVRFTWLGLFILGVKKAMELIEGGIDEIAGRVEEGDSSGFGGALAKIHDALHQRRAHEADTGADALGEM